MFETYFKLNVPKWEVSQKNLVYIMKTAYNVKMFRSRLSELDKDKKINKFLKSLLDYNLDKVPSNNIKVVICVLMDASEKLSLTEFMGIDELYNALIHLAQSLNQNERFETIKNAIIISESQYNPVIILKHIDYHYRSENKDNFSDKRANKHIESRKYKKDQYLDKRW